MQSLLDPSVLYTDLSRDITEHDVDVVSDLWNMDDRDVYRGSRDRHYSHANVYWLYTEELERVGLVEHSLTDNADFRILWFQNNPFATLLQENDWVNEESIWSTLSLSASERFLASDWTTPEKILTACLYGPTRVLSVDMLLNRPTVYSCRECGWKSLKKLECCDTDAPLDFPDKSKILFIDEDLYVCRPPADSKVWELLGFTSPRPPRDDERALRASAQVQQESLQLEPPPRTPSPPAAPAAPQESSLQPGDQPPTA